jgi:hypothetical protein
MLLTFSNEYFIRLFLCLFKHSFITWLCYVAANKKWKYYNFGSDHAVQQTYKTWRNLRISSSSWPRFEPGTSIIRRKANDYIAAAGYAGVSVTYTSAAPLWLGGGGGRRRLKWTWKCWSPAQVTDHNMGSDVSYESQFSQCKNIWLSLIKHLWKYIFIYFKNLIYNSFSVVIPLITSKNVIFSGCIYFIFLWWLIKWLL